MDDYDPFDYRAFHGTKRITINVQNNADPEAPVESGHHRTASRGNQIRLLKVKSGQGPVIEASIKFFDLDCISSYWALSYTWDHESPWKIIKLDSGETLNIRERLEEVLFLFRERHPDEYIWIDQICINQWDKEEKSHQVSLMAQIYSTAYEVIVWLPSWPSGYGENAVSEAVELIHAYEANVELSPIREIKAEHALEIFTQHSYWRRTWVVQEIWLASRIEIYWVDQTISWKAYCEYFQSNSGHTWTQRFFSSKGAQFGHILGASKVLRHIANSLCEDPRDKWYAIQGLISPSMRTNIDYNKTTDTVFQEAAISIMKTSTDWMFTEDLLNLAQAMGLQHDVFRGIEDMVYHIFLPHHTEEFSVTVWLKTQQLLLTEGDRQLERMLLDEIQKIIQQPQSAYTYNSKPFLNFYMVCKEHVSKTAKQKGGHTTKNPASSLRHKGV